MIKPSAEMFTKDIMNIDHEEKYVFMGKKCSSCTSAHTKYSKQAAHNNAYTLSTWVQIIEKYVHATPL